MLGSLAGKMVRAVGLAAALWGGFRWFQGERDRRIAAEAEADRLADNVMALQDTTRDLGGQVERMAVQVRASDAVAEDLAALVQKAKAETALAGVTVLRPADTVWAERPADVTLTQVEAEIDTNGVQAHVVVRLSDRLAQWRVSRDPVRLSLAFVEREGKPFVEATSSDGARLEIQNPFVLAAPPPSPKGHSTVMDILLLTGGVVLGKVF